MADLALRGLEDAVKALTTRDRQLAYAAILRDSRIDDLESAIDSMCVEFIVRHIPVAHHLRFAHSVAKIISELERVGDYAESINRQAIFLSTHAARPDLARFEKLAQVSIEMVRQAVRSFLDGDIELAEKTMDLDVKANKIHHEIYKRDLLAILPQTTDELAVLYSLLSVSNRFERVADQADNICEEVSYIVTGEMVKHQLKHDVGVLFVSSSNSCRGLMAERIAKHIAGDHFDFSSAGVDAAKPDKKAVAFLAEQGINASGHESIALSSLKDFKPFAVVVAIGEEAAQAIPEVGYKRIRLAWDVENPTTMQSDDAYSEVFNDLLERITSLIQQLHGTTTKLPTDEEPA